MADADVPWWDGLPCDTCAHQAVPGLPLLSYFKPSVLRFLSCQRKGDSSSLPGGVATRGCMRYEAWGPRARGRRGLQLLALALPPLSLSLLPSLVFHPQHIP